MKFKYLALALLPLSIAACQSSDIQKFTDTAVNILNQQSNTADRTLSSYQWSYQPSGTSKPIVLNFGDKRLSIATGCNTQGTSWQVVNDKIVTSDLMSTMIGCPSDLAKQEQYAASIFQKREIPFVLNTANVEQPTLTVTDAQGKQVVFTGKMTPETKYQSQGETIFLEVSPETKSCTGVAPQTCLLVREIKYDDKGIKTQVDKDWTYFYDQIEGFKHNPDERQVVRIKRYELKNPAADQSKYAYVQDMIIERETIKK
ncbi:DUF4377 domain-containing protein [Acinetobacter stercoris]|uniref:META domain protein n=1 Tax=Acinetobacter stercoris TaxID=2126983 RepID=A0A2U3N430_9GAMM|nr:DUF4377 domain-containing protein [Acinetobacter stercoris]SPL72447.1 META domain protein [Acinetobacter stercoris]